MAALVSSPAGRCTTTYYVAPPDLHSLEKKEELAGAAVASLSAPDLMSSLA